MRILELPEPLRGATHVRLLYVEARFLGDDDGPSEISATVQPGHLNDAGAFEADPDLPVTTRKVADVTAFLAANKGGPTVADLVRFVGAEEYRARGLEAVSATLAELPAPAVAAAAAPVAP